VHISAASPKLLFIPTTNPAGRKTNTHELKERGKNNHGWHGFETRSAPALLGATLHAFTFYLGNPFSSIPGSSRRGNYFRHSFVTLHSCFVISFIRVIRLPRRGPATAGRRPRFQYKENTTCGDAVGWTGSPKGERPGDREAKRREDFHLLGAHSLN
jgi:hypothetical protein